MSAYEKLPANERAAFVGYVHDQLSEVMRQFIGQHYRPEAIRAVAMACVERCMEEFGVDAVNLRKFEIDLDNGRTEVLIPETRVERNGSRFWHRVAPERLAS